MSNDINNTSDKAVMQSRKEFEERQAKSAPSLSDLVDGNTNKKEVSVTDNLSSLTNPNEEYVDPSMVSINDIISSEEEVIEDVIVEEKVVARDALVTQETIIEKEIDELDEEVESYDHDTNANKEVHTPTHIDNLIREIEDMDKDPVTTNTILEDITKLAKEELGKVSSMNKIDINKFVVANEPINLLQVMERSTVGVNTADWVLMDTGKRISMKEFSGMEIEMLNPANSRRNQYNTTIDIFTNIHDHILNNPVSTELDTFLKSVHYSDMDSLYYAAYRASFNDSNKITYICPNENCNHVFLEDVKMDDMYKFDSDEAEKRFWNIYDTGEEELISSTVVREQISDNFVADIINPSIYSIVVESTLLDDDFVAKYSDIIGILSFVQRIYKIDHDTNSLVPIHLKEYSGDKSKTLRYKILNYAQILRSLTSYEYSRMMKLIEAVGMNSDGITYIIPESQCTKCKTKIEEHETTADDLIFTRHRLDILANS